ncbi:unnamed protein product [Ectocarpus sp. CCAP 1310/34]|nr:unnamed protein product [Ectocarpus sp. CCAP 1310/34]
MYVVNLILDDLNPDLPSAPLVFRADTDAGVWHRRMGHCNARALKQLSDKEGTGIKFTTNIRPADYNGRFLAMCRSFGIAVETSPPYVPQGNAVAERGFGTVIGAARSLMLGAPHLPHQLWAEAVKAAIYITNRTPTDVLDGKAPLEVWEDKPLGSLKHMHEWGSVTFTHLEARSRNDKFSARARKYYMVAYNTTSKTWRLWDPAEPLKISNSAEVSFREVDARDVARPMHGSDPFPEQGQIFQPGIITGAETRDEEAEPADTSDGPDEEPPAVRKSGRTTKSRNRLNLFATEQVFETEYALVIGGEIGNLGQGMPGQLGYMPADLPNYRAAVNGSDAVGWMKSMEEENRSLLDHDVYEWVDSPRDAQIIPSKYIYKWAPVATAFLHARMERRSKPVYVIPPEGFSCDSERARQVWKLRSWLYGLRFSPKGWWGTLHDFFLKIGFVESTAEPCLFILKDGDVLLLVYVDDILLTGEGENKVLSIVDQRNERLETVDLGGARFLLGMGINRDRAAGTILLEQEAYTNAVLDKFGMADARPTTSPSEAGPVSVLEDEVLSAEDTTYFRSATGSLLYLSRCTRPDITHSVMVLTRCMAKPGPRAMQKLKRVLRYLKGTISIGVRHGEDAEDGNVITAFVDSDFAGDLDKGYSTTGVVLYFAGGPVEWTSSKQTVVATSSVEAEFVALSKGCNIIKYFRHLLDTINQTQEEATVVWKDNSGALK